MNYDYKDIFNCYKDSWDNLVSFLNSDSGKTGALDNYGIDIADKISPILYAFVSNVAEKSDNQLKIGRGIIQLNSLKTNTRIRIPVTGKEIDTYEIWASNQTEWKNNFNRKSDSNDKSLMFLQPDEPHHLLTELMWRFQTKQNEKLAVVVQTLHDKDIINKIENDNNANKFSCIEINTKKEFNDIKNDIQETLNKLLPKDEDNKSKIPLLKKRYDEKDCISLLENPYKILSGKIDPYQNENKPSNIFYVSDIIETDYLGSFDFELIYDKNNFDITKLCAFIKEVRWFLSKFIIELVATAEKNFVSAGDIYRDVYFWRDDTTGKFEGLEGFIKCLEPSIDEKKSKIYRVYDKVRNHFHIANTDNGDYWRGYKRHAYEVACTVAGVIDILFLEDNGEFENFIRQQGPRLEGLNDKFENDAKHRDLPHLFKQLFRGLEREKELFLLPKYRDHFIHSFYCFSFGLILMNKSIPEIMPTSLNNKDENVIKKWFITSMWHDIAYVLEKGNEIIEKYVLNFIKKPKRYKNVLPWIPHVGSLMQIENLLDEANDLFKDSIKIPTIKVKDNDDIIPRDIILAVALEDINHGIWSSLFVYHCLYNEDNLFPKEYRKKNQMEICRAILPHHISEWKVGQKLKNDFDIERDHEKKWEQEAYIDADSNSLGYLLSLCDTLCQAGREAKEMIEFIDKERASRLNIKYKSITYDDDRKKLSVALVYGDELNDSKEENDDNSTINKFYRKPFRCLKLLECGTDVMDNNIIEVKIQGIQNNVLQKEHIKQFVKKKVILLQPLGKLDQPSGFMRTCNLEPLALEYLQSALEQIHISTSLHYGKINEEALFKELSENKPLAICFSVYTYQYLYCLQLAQRIKEFFADTEFVPKIIFGGYHSSAVPEEIIKKKMDVDFVVVGEGEETLKELVEAIKNGKDFSAIKGIWYRDPNPHFTGARNRIENIDWLPFPQRHTAILANTGQYQITYPPPSKQKNVAQVTYSRGCPYSCSFCSSENMWGKGKVIWRKPSKVLDEIEMLYNQYGTNLIYFPDLTFNVDKKKVEEICNEFIKRNLPVHWWGLFRLDQLDDNMLHVLKEAKCIKLSIGFEANDVDAVKVKGHYSIQRDKYMDILNTANDIGLIIKAFLIIGFPNDTEEKIRHYKDFVLNIPVDEIRVTFITPFPGTAIWKEYKQNNILPKDINWNDFTTENPVINHKSLTNEQLMALRTEIVREFYLDERYAKHVIDKVSKHHHLKDSFKEYFQFLEEKNIFPNEKPTNTILTRM